MKGNTLAKRIVVALIILSVCMTASPLVILANKIEPFTLGVPFFFFWNVFWPTMLFVLSILYTKIVDHESK